MSLHECPACQRHVKDSETSCPFCGAVVAPARPHAHRHGAVRLGRAALLALGAGAAALACDNADPPKTIYGGPPATLDAGPPAPLAVDASTPTSDSTMADAAAPDYPPRTIYGAPPLKKKP